MDLHLGPTNKCPRRILGTIGEDPSVLMSNWLYVVICWFFFINIGYIPKIPLNFIDNFLEVLKFIQSFFKLNRFICN